MNSGTSCTVTVSAIGSNHLLVLFVFLLINGAGTGLVTAVNGGGGTWQQGSGPGCVLTPVDNAYVDCWYNLSPNTASTSIVATINGSGGTARGAVFYEYSSTGTPAFNASNASENGDSSANPQPGLGPNMAGSNNIAFQAGYADAGVTINSIDTGYALTSTGAGSRKAAVLENSTNTAAPSYTLSASARFTSSVMSFKDANAASFHSNVSVIVVGP
jgi:hypothetical protein